MLSCGVDAAAASSSSSTGDQPGTSWYDCLSSCFMKKRKESIALHA